MLFVSENDRRNNIYTLGNLTIGNLRLYLHTFKVFLRYHHICLCIAQTLRVCVHRLAVPTSVCIANPFILGVFLTTIKRSTVASSLAQQLNTEVSNHMALNLRENQAEIIHLNFVSWYLHMKTWLLLLLPRYTFVMVMLLCPATAVKVSTTFWRHTRD